MKMDYCLYLVTDHGLSRGRSNLEIIRMAMEGGATVVQLREKEAVTREFLKEALLARAYCREQGVTFIINDRIDIALAVQADGVHLGEHSLPTDVVRQLIGSKLLIGVSTHSNAAISRAAEQGADFVTFGPVYATPSKTAFGPPQGLKALAEACRGSSLPVFALGGITPPRAAEVRQAGASGIALISAILANPTPCTVAESFNT